MNYKKWLYVVPGVAALVVLLQNTHVVSFYFFFWRVQMSLIILITVLLVSGFCAGYFIRKK